MTTQDDVARLADALNGIATLYQFRSLSQRLYGALTVSQSYCLRILYFQGMRTMSELAEKLQVRLSTITGVIDQLEERGLVERSGHPEDRRSLHVRLTPKGRSLYGNAHEAFLSHLKPLLEGRTPADREKLLSFLADVTDSIRGWQKDPRRKVKSHGKNNSKRRNP
jgi:DNA-binding MarR family transcriptional regulator